MALCIFYYLCIMIYIKDNIYSKSMTTKGGLKYSILYIKSICTHCGKECFHRKSGFDKGTKPFCNRSCQRSHHNKTLVISKAGLERIVKHHRESFRGDGNPNWRGGPVRFVCNNCGEYFFLKRDHLSDRDGKFCSIGCYHKYIADNKIPPIQDRIHRSIKGGMLKSLRSGKNGRKNGRKWESLLGYTTVELMNHLEKLFTDGMSWDNYGTKGWHIDHIIPKSCFHFSDIKDDEFIKCWSLSNLQPLWAIDNLKKGGVNRMRNLKQIKS